MTKESKWHPPLILFCRCHERRGGQEQPGVTPHSLRPQHQAPPPSSPPPAAISPEAPTPTPHSPHPLPSPQPALSSLPPSQKGNLAPPGCNSAQLTARELSTATSLPCLLPVRDPEMQPGKSAVSLNDVGGGTAVVGCGRRIAVMTCKSAVISTVEPKFIATHQTFHRVLDAVQQIMV